VSIFQFISNIISVSYYVIVLMLSMSIFIIGIFFNFLNIKYKSYIVVF
jgi:hypothetical protein